MADGSPWEAYQADDAGPWAKYAQPAQTTPAGTFQTKPGGKTYNISTLGTEPLTPLPGLSASTAAKARVMLPGFQNQVEQSKREMASQIQSKPGRILSAYGGSLVGGLPGAAIGAGLPDIGGPVLRGESPDYKSSAENAALTYTAGRLLPLVGRLIPGKGAIASALRTESGTLRPIVKAGARLAGLGLGYKLGGDLGAAVGALGGTSLLDSAIPQLPAAELGSAENPGWFVKLPSRMPTRLGAGRLLPGGGLQEPPLVIPEPTQLFAGEEPNYMASTPRDELAKLAASGKLGAGTQLQQLGRRVIYVPRSVIGQR